MKNYQSNFRILVSLLCVIVTFSIANLEAKNKTKTRQQSHSEEPFNLEIEFDEKTCTNSLTIGKVDVPKGKGKVESRKVVVTLVDENGKPADSPEEAQFKIQFPDNHSYLGVFPENSGDPFFEDKSTTKKTIEANLYNVKFVGSGEFNTNKSKKFREFIFVSESSRLNENDLAKKWRGHINVQIEKGIGLRIRKDLNSGLYSAPFNFERKNFIVSDENKKKCVIEVTSEPKLNEKGQRSEKKNQEVNH